MANVEPNIALSARAADEIKTTTCYIDCPGGLRYKAPFPRTAPPVLKPRGKPGDVKPGQALAGPQLGFPTGPEDLLVDAEGTPQRIDKAFSWDAPLAAQGMMHMVIANAARGDPYPISRANGTSPPDELTFGASLNGGRK